MLILSRERGSEWSVMPIRSLASSLELFFLMRVEVLEGVEELRLWTGDIVIVIDSVSIIRSFFSVNSYRKECIQDTRQSLIIHVTLVESSYLID
jgi:hypothetical protein